MKIFVLLVCLCVLSDRESHKKVIEKNIENVVQTALQQIFELETRSGYGYYKAPKHSKQLEILIINLVKDEV